MRTMDEARRLADAGEFDHEVGSNRQRCTLYSRHRAVNLGRSEPHFADVFACPCGGYRDIANTDEHRARYATSPGSES